MQFSEESKGDIHSEIDENIRHRGNAYNTRRSSRKSLTGEIEDPFLSKQRSDSPEINRNSGDRTRSLYCKSQANEKVNLEDF